MLYLRRGAGIAVANCFSLLRCLLFGFFPTAVVLYLVYYNLFAVVFGLLGRRLKKSAELPRLAVLAACAVVMTVLFTMLDNVITPLFFGYSRRAALVYFYNSLPVMCVQTACTAITVCLLFVPLRKAFALIGHRVIRSAKYSSFSESRAQNIPLFRRAARKIFLFLDKPVAYPFRRAVL